MSAVASQEMSRLHDLMCVEALEGGLDVMQRREFSTLAKTMPEVNTSYYWEALGAADLALYGASLVPPSDARKAWLQDASAHFGWSEADEVVAPPQVAPAAKITDPLDETIAVAFEDDDELDDDCDFAGNLHQDASPSLAAVDEPLDETVMSWDERAIDVDQYASDRGLRETLAEAPRSSNALGWTVLVLLALMAGAAFNYKAQILELADSWGLVPANPLQGEQDPVHLAAGGAAIGGFVWDPALQQGRLNIDAMPANIDSQRQFQVWVVDSGRDGAAIPVALLRTNLVAHQVDVKAPVFIKQYGGLLISSEPLGGALSPSQGSVIARVDLPQQ